MAKNPHALQTDSPDSPARRLEAVTPSDTVDLVYMSRALYVGTAGDISVIDYFGATVLLKNVPVGVLPVCVQRVRATGTTASNIVGLS